MCMASQKMHPDELFVHHHVTEGLSRAQNCNAYLHLYMPNRSGIKSKHISRNTGS